MSRRISEAIGMGCMSSTPEAHEFVGGFSPGGTLCRARFLPVAGGQVEGVRAEAA